MADDWEIQSMKPASQPKGGGDWEVASMAPAAIPGTPPGGLPQMKTPIPPQMQSAMLPDPFQQQGNMASGGSIGTPPDTGKGTLNALPVVGGAVGGAFGGPTGAALGGIVGEGLKQAGSPSTNPPLEMLKSGGEQGALELGGKALNYVGGKLVPNKVKQAAAGVLKGQLDSAGQAIDAYLRQPNLANVRVNIAQPVNDLLDDEIAKAGRAGAKPLAKRLEQLQSAWNTNYNLTNPTLPEANAFRREIAQFTNFSGEAHKVTLNQIQKRANGIVGEQISQNAPGVAALNANYSNLVSMQGAIKSGAKSATSGIKGAALAGTSLLAQKTGQALPNTARVTQLFMQKNGEQ